MKARRDGGWGWKPFDVVLTVESEEEAKALYAIFNYSPNVNLLPEDASDEIRKAIGGKYSTLGTSQLIARGVCYREFYLGKREG
ncbi:hypothetical protein LCGC14_1948430 [marine sediment metagenome]|uniref:Uncharacterized protein n=1 Tax=marine sediment metagenome TaxID=412755 RepID=A0A0F9G6K7_9ZZZZ